MSMGIDYSARLLISLCLQKAAREINENNHELLDLVKSLDVDTARTIIVRIMAEEKEQSEEKQQTEFLQEKIDSLRERRDKLKAMVEMYERLFTSIDTDIATLEKKLRNIPKGSGED